MPHLPLSERRGSGHRSAHGTARLRAKSNAARLLPGLPDAPGRMVDSDGVSRVGSGPKDGNRGARTAVTVDAEKCGVLHALPRMMQILRVLVRRGFPGAMLGRKRWPSPKNVREALEELGLVFLKFGQVLAVRRDLLPTAYTKELELLHDELTPMGIDTVRATVEVFLF